MFVFAEMERDRERLDGELTALFEDEMPPDPGDPFHWHVTDGKRAKRFRKPEGDPPSVWFEQF